MENKVAPQSKGIKVITEYEYEGFTRERHESGQGGVVATCEYCGCVVDVSFKKIHRDSCTREGHLECNVCHIPYGTPIRLLEHIIKAHLFHLLR